MKQRTKHKDLLAKAVDAYNMMKGALGAPANERVFPADIALGVVARDRSGAFWWLQTGGGAGHTGAASLIEQRESLEQWYALS